MFELIVPDIQGDGINLKNGGPTFFKFVGLRDKSPLMLTNTLQTWERDSSWLYCIDFLREEEHPYSWRYRYAVKWSIPTRRKPIPRATASVYITIEVSKFKPKVIGKCKAYSVNHWDG